MWLVTGTLPSSCKSGNELVIPLNADILLDRWGTISVPWKTFFHVIILLDLVTNAVLPFAEIRLHVVLYTGRAVYRFCKSRCSRIRPIVITNYSALSWLYPSNQGNTKLLEVGLPNFLLGRTHSAQRSNVFNWLRLNVIFLFRSFNIFLCF